MIRINNVTFNYRKRKVFADLNLQLNSGSIYGLLGKNGVGKTTLLKLISGLLAPNSGEITVLNQNPTKRHPSFLSEVFVLSEEFDLPRMSIMEYAKYYGVFYPNFSTDQLLQLLTELKVEHDQMMHSMSFGQKKKALIAFAIACNTKLLIMDEPTNALDIPSKSSFRRVISALASENRTIIISTHQVRDLDQLIDRVVILDESSILLNASINKITDKLFFTNLAPTEDAIYAEQTIHGRWGVKLNSTGAESQMDMEILFNAVTTNPQIIKTVFDHE